MSHFAKRLVSVAMLAGISGALVLGLPLEARAFSTGSSGHTNKTGGNACQSCHGNSGTTVVLSGASALDKGQTSTYTVTLTRTTASQPAGVNIAATDGNTLGLVGGMPTTTSGSGLGKEIIHSSSIGALRTTSSNVATYTFNFTMPAGAASGAVHTLYAAGAVDSPGGSAHAANFLVKAKPTAPSSVAPSNITAASVDLAWSGTGPHYRVVYKAGATAPTSPTDGTATVLDLGTATSTTVSGLSSTTQYSFAVFAKLNPDNIFSTTAATTTATTTAPVMATRYVNAATGANSGGCTVPASPCKTITYAMSQATAGTPGDLVSVAPGTYDVANGETFPIVMKNGVQLVSTGTAENTIVDATGANNRVIDILGFGNVGTLVEGFTITGGLRNPPADGTLARGGGLFIQNGSPVVRKNIFVGNEARGYDGISVTFVSGGHAHGGAIYVEGGSPTISGNVIRGNTARGGTGVSRPGLFTPASDGGNGFGGGMHITGVGAGGVYNNTFHGNSAIGGNGGFSLGPGGAGGQGDYGGLISNDVFVNNNIFANNAATGGAGGAGAPPGIAGFASTGGMQYSNIPSGDASNNLFFGNTANGGASSDTIGTNSVCFIGPPCASMHFYSEPTNLRITSLSPAAGAGTAAGAPSDDMDGVVRANPPSIGAFEAVDPTNIYNIVLEGWQEVPYVVTPATGTGTATFNTVTKALTLNLPYAGLTGTETAAHIHGPAARGANAGVLFALGGTSPKTNTVSLTAQQETQLLAGQLYVNIHTSPYPGGELRAQIDNVGATVTRVLTVSKAGTGAGTVTGTAEPGQVVNCGSDCTETVPNGKVVALTATPAGGSTFASWSGSCTGTAACNVTMDAAKSVTATFNVSDPPRLGNISTRMQVLTGNDVMIGGFVIGGSANKTVVVRARGPSLIPFGITNALANPQLQLVRSSDQQQIAFNDNWQSASNAADITASGFAPGNDLEAAILINLAPGAYTAIVSGVGNTTGVGIVEVFEVDVPLVPLVNISTRGQVLTGNDVMIGGFIVQGSGPQTVVVRARGPSLIPFGITNALANPQLQLVRSSDQQQIAFNDDWQSASNAADVTASGFAPSNNLEAAILITLQPGAYTAIVTGVGGGTGVGIVEVFATN